MKYIFSNGVFDTKKAEVVAEYEKYYFCGRIEQTLYTTKKKNWFIVDRTGCEKVGERMAMKILKSLNDVENYEKYFGELEEL